MLDLKLICSLLFGHFCFLLRVHWAHVFGEVMSRPELLVTHQTPELHPLHVGLNVVTHGPPVLVHPVTHLASEGAVLSFLNVLIDFLVIEPT